jgi:hypothetical protein
MKRVRKETDEPRGRLEVVDDFLLPPDELVLREDGVKVTVALSRKSIEFFKAHAARAGVPYQRMIRALLDAFADRHGGPPTPPIRRMPRPWATTAACPRGMARRTRKCVC